MPRKRTIFYALVLLLVLLVFFFPRKAGSVTYAIEGDVIGEILHYTVKEGDNLYAIARQFDVGIVEIIAANDGVDVWMPEPGTELVLTTQHLLPAARHGIVINLSELRLYYFPDKKTVMTFPIGIGREGWPTPLGRTTIVKKRENPVWIPPQSILLENLDLPKLVPPGPDNPLGNYALDLGWKNYRIHGTNHPNGVGSRVSHGCIRLYPEDIAALFPLVKPGTPVMVIDKTYKLGWRENKLWLEVTPNQEESDDVLSNIATDIRDIPELHQAIDQMAGDRSTIYWYAIDAAISMRNGIPVIAAEHEKPGYFTPD